MNHFKKYLLLFCVLYFCISSCAPKPPKVSSSQLEDRPRVVTPKELQTTYTREPRPEEDSIYAIDPADPISSPESTSEISDFPMMPSGLGENQQIAFVEKRLTAYEKKFQYWLEIKESNDGQIHPQFDQTANDECMVRFDRLLAGYSQLQDRKLYGNISSRNHELNEILIQDIAFLESECGRRLAAGSNSFISDSFDSSPNDLIVQQTENLLDQYFKNYDFEMVISTYQANATSHPDKELSLFSTKQYGLALLFTGDIGAATNIFSRIQKNLNTQNNVIDPWSTQRMEADLLLASGKLQAARVLYEDLLKSSKSFDSEKSWIDVQLDLLDSGDESLLGEYLGLLRDYLAIESRQQNPLDLITRADRLSQISPGSPIAEGAFQIRQNIDKNLWELINSLISKAEKLVEENNFTEAASVLRRVTPEYLPNELREILLKAIENVATAEEKEFETRRLLTEEALTMQWDSANNLFDSRRYDEAIEGFKMLLGTEYEANARLKIEKATNLAAAAKRKKAATFFINAVKTSDYEQKKELLLNSRQLLQEILINYPGATIIDKVTQNLKTVEEHIIKFDPLLLEDDTDPDDLFNSAEKLLNNQNQELFTPLGDRL